MAAIESVSTVRKTLTGLALDKRVRRLILFGSHAKGNAQEGSDLDFYVDSNYQLTGFAFFALKGQLENAFQKDIDLISDVDVIANSRVDQEIKRTGVTVYSAVS